MSKEFDEVAKMAVKEMYEHAYEEGYTAGQMAELKKRETSTWEVCSVTRFRCKKCKIIFDRGHKYCPNCGVKMEMKK